MLDRPLFPAHALLDSGAGEKLERFGPVVLRRPDPRALWRPRLSAQDWRAADLFFEPDPASDGKRGRWGVRDPASAGGSQPGRPAVPREALGPDPAWTIAWEGVRFRVRPTPFRHVGVFPEQAANWAWIRARAGVFGVERAPHLLNLFGYTGVASLVALAAGFRVTHVDASRAALGALRENLSTSALSSDGLRIVLDDALAYARREVRRGVRYQGILLDPPHHGRGPKGETWQLEVHMAPLIEVCADLLGERAFLVVSTYASMTSPAGLESLLADLPGGHVESGELALREEDAGQSERREGAGVRPGRVLPAGFAARWARGLEPERVP